MKSLYYTITFVCAMVIADQILTLIRTSGLFMDTDMVKGLMFEKCAKCERKDWKSPEEIPNATICPKCNEMHWIK